jgi:hypothetical protein
MSTPDNHFPGHLPRTSSVAVLILSIVVLVNTFNNCVTYSNVNKLEDRVQKLENNECNVHR